MSGPSRKWSRRTAQLTAVGLLAASGSMFFASTALAAAGANGNNGTVLINGVNASNPGNDPHITCPITINWQGFDPAPTKDDYKVTVTAVQPTGGTATFTAPQAANPLTGTFTGPDNTLAGVEVQVNGGNAHKGEYHVNITVETQLAHSTDTKSKTVWVQNCAANPAGGNVTMAGTCTTNTPGSGYTWAVTATPGVVGAGADVTGTWAGGGTNGTWSTTNGTGSFNTPSAANAITVALDNNQPGWTITPPAAAPTPCGAVIPPPPGGGHVTVTGQCNTTTQGYDWTVAASSNASGVAGTWAPTGGGGGNWTTDASGMAVFSSGVGENVVNITVTTPKWTGPATATATACVTPGQAAAVVTEANHCASGMNLTLSNMNGTAPATFTVVDPDGNVQTVTVNAGQLKKLVFAVKEDTTGTVSVTVAGGSKQAFVYKKNCATVLGVKHTRKPPHKPVVKGEHQQLPFTGFETKRALLDGAVVFFLGAVLCILGARRQEEEPLYY